MSAAGMTTDHDAICRWAEERSLALLRQGETEARGESWFSRFARHGGEG